YKETDQSTTSETYSEYSVTDEYEEADQGTTSVTYSVCECFLTDESNRKRDEALLKGEDLDPGPCLKTSLHAYIIVEKRRKLLFQ
ncbi:hypothetical protein TNCT_336261, partial [Trichonephila clavata]